MECFFWLIAELPGRPGLAVIGGADGLCQIGGIAFDHGGVADWRFVDNRHARDEAVLDLDVDGYEILEDDAPGRRGIGLTHGIAPSIGGRCGAAGAAPLVRHSAANRWPSSSSA